MSGDETIAPEPGAGQPPLVVEGGELVCIGCQDNKTQDETVAVRACGHTLCAVCEKDCPACQANTAQPPQEAA